MNIVKYELQNKMLTVGFKENNFAVYTTISYDEKLTKQQLLQKAYEQCKSSIDYEKSLKEHSFTCDEKGEEFISERSKATKLKVDFNILKGVALDQYGEVFSKDVVFGIDGTDKATIKDNKIIESQVKENTKYFIIAKYNDLVEKQERYIYPHILEEPKVNQDAVVAFEAIAGLDDRINKLEKVVNK